METIKDILIKFQEYQLKYNVLNVNCGHNAAANLFMEKYDIKNCSIQDVMFSLISIEESKPTKLSGDTFEFKEGDVEYTEKCLIQTENELEIGYYIPKLNMWVDRETFELGNVSHWCYI